MKLEIIEVKKQNPKKFISVEKAIKSPNTSSLLQLDYFLFKKFKVLM